MKIVEFLKNNKWKVVTGLVAAVLLVAFVSSASAAEVDRAPVSVTQERVLDSGDTEFFYVYNNEKTSGVGVTSSHAFGGLWAPFDFVTVGASTDYNDSVANGFGDVFVSGTASVNLLGVDVRPSVGVSIPNGFVEGSPAANQFSSGSVDLVPALTVLVGGDTGLQLGAQYKGVFRVDNNNDSYAFGDENLVTGWASVQPVDYASVYVFANAKFVGESTGVFVADSYESVSVGAGVNTYVSGFRVSAEASVPVVDEYNGLTAAFEEARTVRVGVQRAF